MSNPFGNRHHEQRVGKDADQTELEAIRRGEVLIEAGLFDDRVSGALDDFEMNDPSITQEAWASQDTTLDTAVSQIGEELRHRASLLGDDYPFVLMGNRIRHRRSRSYFYEFCLAASNTSNYSTGDLTGLPRSFERWSAVLVQKYLGSESFSLHVGFPRDAEVGTTFRAAMETAHQRTQEWKWGPEFFLDGSEPAGGDHGLDFIVWKESPDRRLGKLFVIGQCACGNDWNEKFGDLSYDKLKRWFNPLSIIQPVRAFTTPHLLTDINLNDAQTQAGLVFDRARLIKLAERHSRDPEIVGWQDQIVRLAHLVIG